MARKRALSAREVDALMHKLGTHRVDENLYLQIREDGTKSWVFRYSRGGKMRSLGLGAVRRIPYAKVRTLAAEYRTRLWRGVDIAAEHRGKREQIGVTADVASSVPTFAWCAEQYVSAHEAGWKNPKHRYQWRATLDQYAGPVIGHLPVDQVLRRALPFLPALSRQASRGRWHLGQAALYGAKRGLSATSHHHAPPGSVASAFTSIASRKPTSLMPRTS